MDITMMYLSIVLLAFTVLPCVGADGLRVLVSHYTQGTPGQTLPTDANSSLSGPTKEFNAIVNLMNAQYNNDCQTMATEDTTTVSCSKPGQSAVLEGDGAGDPIYAQTLKICMTTEVSLCNCVDFTTINHDVQYAKLMLGDSGPDADWISLSNLLLTTYGYSDCNTKHQECQTALTCTQPGGSATLYGTGGADPIPESLVVCAVATSSGTVCQDPVEFITISNDLQAAQDALNS
jgi:hypothetical protein